MFFQGPGALVGKNRGSSSFPDLWGKTQHFDVSTFYPCAAIGGAISFGITLVIMLMAWAMISFFSLALALLGSLLLSAPIGTLVWVLVAAPLTIKNPVPEDWEGNGR